VFWVSKWVMRTILDIYVPRAFQGYKELLNLIGFLPFNYSLKIQESIRTLIPKMGAHLGVLRVWGFILSHSPTLLGTWDVIPELPSWPTPLQALALVMNPRLRLRHFMFHNIKDATLEMFHKVHKGIKNVDFLDFVLRKTFLMAFNMVAPKKIGNFWIFAMKVTWSILSQFQIH